MAERKWDKYEAALLIDTYKSIDVGAFKRNIAVAKLSNNLRKRAENLGLSIDSKYRNTNGISMMLSTLVYLFSDGTKQPFKMPNNIFQEVYKIYRDNPKEFETLLAEAKKQCSDGFSIQTVGIKTYKEIVEKNEIDDSDHTFNNKIDLLKRRYIDYCEKKGQFNSFDSNHLLHWLDMLDLRLRNLKVINTSIFDVNDYERFCQFKKANKLDDVLIHLVGRFNHIVFSSFLSGYIEYIDTLSQEDKQFLKSLNDKREEVIVVKPSEIINMEEEKETELGKNIHKKLQSEFTSFCKEKYGISQLVLYDNLKLLFELEKHLIEDGLISYGIFDYRDYSRLKNITKTTKDGSLTAYTKKYFAGIRLERVKFYYSILCEFLNGKFENISKNDSGEVNAVVVEVSKEDNFDKLNTSTSIISNENKIEHNKSMVEENTKKSDLNTVTMATRNNSTTLTKYEANLKELEAAIGIGPFYEYYKNNVLSHYKKTMLFNTVNNIYLLKQAVHVHFGFDFTCASPDSLDRLKQLDDCNKIKSALRLEYARKYNAIYLEFKIFMRAFVKWKIINKEQIVESNKENMGIAQVEQKSLVEEILDTQIKIPTVLVQEKSSVNIELEKSTFVVFLKVKRKLQSKTIEQYMPYLDSLNNALLKDGIVQYGIYNPQELDSLITFRRSDRFTSTLKQYFTGGVRTLVCYYFDYLIEYLKQKKETGNDKEIDAGLDSAVQNKEDSRIGEIASVLETSNVSNLNNKLADNKVSNNTEASVTGGEELKKEETVCEANSEKEYTKDGTTGKYKEKAEDNNTDLGDLLVKTLIENNINYVDKRNKGGCLWVEGGPFDEYKLEKLKILGAKFRFSSGSSSALGFRNGWWTKDVINKINEEPDPAPVNPSSETYENFIHMLNKYYSKGFRVGSGIEIKKFKSQWQSEFNKDMPSDSIINKFIDDLTITIGKKAYLPDILLPAQIKEKIFAYIRDSFASDKHMIYYEALYNHFSQELLNSHINNSNMLQAYLRRTNYVNHFYLCEKYFSDIKTIHMDPVEDVRKYLTEAGKPVNIDQIYADLSQISSSEIYRILTGIGSREFINNQKGEYFHVSIVDLSSTDIKNIKEIIDTGLYNYGFISGIDFWNKLKKKHPDMIAQYPYLTDLGMRSVLAFHLGDNYDFRGTIISKKGEKVKSSDVYRRFAQQNTEFTIDDLLKLSEELNTGIYYDEVYNYSVRINDNKFISRELIDFDVDAIDSMLESFCESDYASLETLSIFSGFPYCGYAWNIWLLESFVAKYSKKFILLHSNYNATKCVGAIVKISADINTFDELLSRALADSSVQLTQNMMDNIKNALSYFVQNGFLARKSYSTIESIVNNAIKLR